MLFRLNPALRRAGLIIATPGLLVTLTAAPDMALNEAKRAADELTMRNSAPLFAGGSDIGASPDDGTYVAVVANGERIPHPASSATYPVQDGATTVLVPEGMAYVPAGSFIMGNGSTAHTAKLSG